MKMSLPMVSTSKPSLSSNAVTSDFRFLIIAENMEKRLKHLENQTSITDSTSITELKEIKKKVDSLKSEVNSLKGRFQNELSKQVSTTQPKQGGQRA